MIDSANSYPISQIFDIESRSVYAVPRYQREYSWGRNQCEKFFDDIVENNPEYFLGSIICIHQPTDDPHRLQELELIDGQQRLTTISLLFAAIYSVLKSRESDLDEDKRNDCINLKHRLILKNSPKEHRFIPQIQNNNLDDYRAVLSEVGIINNFETPKNAGNRKIFHAYRYFQKRIEQMINGQDGSIEDLMDFLNKINSVHLIEIRVAGLADAYILFESLNNRGIPLTAVDLIKTKVLAKIEKNDPSEVDKHFEGWNRLLNYLGDDYSTQERFFRQYYNAFKNKFTKVLKEQMATRSNLIHIYDQLIGHDPKDFLRAIGSSAKLYSVILLRDESNSFDQIKDPLQDLERIQGVPSHMLLLYLFVCRGELELTDQHLSSVIDFLVCFFVKRNLTDVPPTRDLTRMFMAIIDGIDGLYGKDVVQFIKQKIVHLSSSDKDFEKKLEGQIYEENTLVTRFILCKLAEQGMTRETWKDLWEIKNKKYVWSIEHIFPQGANIPLSWVKMIAGGDQQKATEIQQTYVHKLGNLTLSGYNSSLGNKSFEEKRDRLDKEHRPIGYKNQLSLNEDLAIVNNWSTKRIDTRTQKLIEQVKKLFSLSV